jgi:hypothetical protein
MNALGNRSFDTSVVFLQERQYGVLHGCWRIGGTIGRFKSQLWMLYNGSWFRAWPSHVDPLLFRILANFLSLTIVVIYMPRDDPRTSIILQVYVEKSHRT